MFRVSPKHFELPGADDGTRSMILGILTSCILSQKILKPIWEQCVAYPVPVQTKNVKSNEASYHSQITASLSFCECTFLRSKKIEKIALEGGGVRWAHPGREELHREPRVHPFPPWVQKELPSHEPVRVWTTDWIPFDMSVNFLFGFQFWFPSVNDVAWTWFKCLRPGFSQKSIWDLYAFDMRA